VRAAKFAFAVLSLFFVAWWLWSDGDRTAAGS